MENYTATLLPESTDVTEVFMKMVLQRTREGKKGLRYSRLYTHYLRIILGNYILPFAIQVKDIEKSSCCVGIIYLN